MRIFAAFHFNNPSKGDSGFGNTCGDSPDIYDDKEIIDFIAKEVKRIKGYEEVIVLNFIKLEEKRERNFSVLQRQQPAENVENIDRFRRVSLHSIALQVAWATTYADPQKLDEVHPEWGNFFAYSEWFRHRICTHLRLPLDTKWDDLYRKLGVLADSEYATEKEQMEAINLGENSYLSDRAAPLMFEEFEEIKYRITNRL